MKCVVEVDVHVITCPGTFLRDYEYVYLHMEMLGLEARTKSVPPTFPFFLHERLKFERTFHDCNDPGLVAAILKGEDCILELRQHTDYITDGKVIAHCSSNTHDFLYPSIPSYYGSGREILLYKTSKFKPIRITGEPVKLEFSTKTTIKEIPDYTAPTISPRRSASPTRRSRTRSVSPSRAVRKDAGSTTVEALPSTRRARSPSPARALYRSKSLAEALDDLDYVAPLSVRTYVDPLVSYRTRYSPNLKAALRSSDRIQARVDDVVRRSRYALNVDSDDDGLDLLRTSLREERNALNEAIKEADKQAFYQSLNKTH